MTKTEGSCKGMESSENSMLRPLWDALLDVYCEFAKLCDANGLKHYVVEGNAIGALRHGGFIPWDDDFDVAMPRPDYERLRKICQTGLPSHLKLLDWRSAPEMQYMMGKIQDCREKLVHEVEGKIGRMLADGIYIDILVIDAMPDGRLKRKAYKLNRRIHDAIRRRWGTPFADWRWRGKIIWLLGWLFSWILGVGSKAEAYSAAEKFMKSVRFGSTGTTWREGASPRTTNMEIPARVWNGVKMVSFEGLSVPIPAGYDEYLRMQYGDYMTPPKQCFRKSTHARTAYSPWWKGPTKL